MFAVCMRYCNCKQDAQDAFQEAFIKVFQNFSTYRGEQKIEAWIRRIMVNTCIDMYRKKKIIIPTENFSDLYDDSSDQEETIKLEHTASRLIELIQELPTQYRNVFNMYVIEEYSHAEVAQQLQITVGTSKSNLSRAKKWLRDMLQEKDLAPFQEKQRNER